MKKVVLLAIVVVALGANALGQDKGRVYESGQVVVPKFYLQSRPDGSTAVINPRKSMILPQYIIKPDGRIYKAGNPVLPVGDVTNGQTKK